MSCKITVPYTPTLFDDKTTDELYAEAKRQAHSLNLFGHGELLLLILDELDTRRKERSAL